MYNVELVDNELDVSVGELKITPEVKNKWFETLHSLINEACIHKYIELINFPKKHPFRCLSANAAIYPKIHPWI